MRSRVTVLTGIFPPDIGGPATSVPDLTRRLAEDGREVVVVTLADDAGVVSTEPFTVVRIPRRMTRVRRAREVVRAVHRTKPDVVLANGLHVESALVTGTPIIHKIVGDWAWERCQNKRWSLVDVETFQRAHLPPRARAVRRLRSLVTGRARLVIVPSRYVRDLVQAWGIPEARIRIVPNAAPTPVASKVPRFPRILFAGRLVRWKHVDHVLYALPSLRDLEFEVVGVGPQLGDLRRLSRSLGLDDRVVFHGALPRKAVLTKMQQSTCLVLPSSYEGMPHVVLEAFAAGLPVVASDAGGIRELVEHDVSGLLYPWGCTTALEDALRTVTTPDVANRLISGGTAVANRLTTQASTAATTAVLEEALQR
jgi:glycosyltransferase involved in cell wall biosynthesis